MRAHGTLLKRLGWNITPFLLNIFPSLFTRANLGKSFKKVPFWNIRI
jgi:hypothetical protein